MPASRKSRSHSNSNPDPLRRIALVAMLIMLVAAAALAWVWHTVHQPRGTSGTVNLLVEPGDSLRSVSEKIAQALDGEVDTQIIYGWARYQQLDRYLRAGEFALTLPDSVAGLIRQVRTARPVQHRLTLVEGWNWRDVLSALSHAEALKKTSLPEDPVELAEVLNLRYPHAEGQFFPDTYFYTRGTTDRALLKRAHERLIRALDEVWQAREDNLPLKSSYEALILASIIEKETAWPEERRRIAGVFVSRLRKKMRLQTDPTVIYGLGVTFDGNIKRRHLNDRSNPYNTYRHAGLPPTPIAMPGRASLEAAVHPEEDGSLYFVANKDGRHTFSRTLEAHNKAVRAYIRHQRTQ
ncbi:MAG: endolytic transglycosylase MltG [Gammaproteobacteria bacterium]|nr:MAG: endolytic transglycosylase MltG [Gammaproteobacteria bacterium]